MNWTTDHATSRRMKIVRRARTTPERIVRSEIRKLGVRFRGNVVGLPGTPDIVGARGRWAILVHGCFWHGHKGCRLATIPKRNVKLWLDKIEKNRARDRRSIRELRKQGIRVGVIWECQTRDPKVIGPKLRKMIINLDSK